jgi:FkbM family methyltransferase
MKFFSQVGQDRFIFDHFFRGKRDGVFVDVGAYDGEKFSNSLFFERHMGWRGMCVEPLSSAFSKLSKTRKAVCEQVCVSDFEGEAEFVESYAGIDEMMLSGLVKSFDRRHVERLSKFSSGTIARKVQVTKLSSLLAKHQLFHIDYCSIDTEGSEFNIISELDLERFHISVFTIENNYDQQDIPKLMAKKGYDFVAKLEQDYVFKRHETKRLPQTSVICAVWHKDPQRGELLQGHAANLVRQTVPVQPIYVFDGADNPPYWLEGQAVSVREALTIYQAWNVGLSLVGTPFVMNLNLDDRLSRNAVELMENALRNDSEALIVGGDWNICYSQRETDEIDLSYSADHLPFVSDWPLLRGTKTRLGSGTGERGTYGPATMWRTEAHLQAPHYPWQLSDGTLLRTAADVAWWHIITNHLKKKAVRLPMVIGNYYSHPLDQAEFRPLPYDETRLMSDPGVSLL